MTSCKRNFKVCAYPVTLALTALLFGTGCKVMQPEKMPAVKTLPATGDHGGEADTANLEFGRFFPDALLVSLIDSALKNNTDMNITRQRIAQAEARLTIRAGALRPSLDAVISGGAERYGDYTMNGVGNFDTNLSPNIGKDQHIPVSPTTEVFAGLRSNWEIDIWGKLRHLKKAAAAELMATREGRQLFVTSLVASVSEAYYELLSLDSRLETVARNITLQEEGLEIVRIQKAGGRASELAVQQFAAQVLNTKAMRLKLLQQRTAVENELNVLVGRYPQPIDRDSSLPAVPGTLPITTGLPARLLARRPDIRQAELALQAAAENVQAARAAFLPSLVISPYIGLNAFTPGLLFKGGSAAYGLLGGLTAPLFHQRMLRSEYAVANAANRELVYQYQQRLLEAYSEASTQMSAIKNFSEACGIKKLEVDQLKDAVTTARDLYLSGHASYLEVILAQNRVLDAELELATYQRDLLVATVQLYRALGGGWK